MKVHSWSGSENASTYYRQEVPFKTAQKLGLIDWDRSEWPSSGDASAWTVLMVETMKHTDVFHNYSSMNQAIDQMIQMSQNGRKRGEKAPLFLYDCDDNTRDVNPLNPVFETLGTRGIDGKPLRKGGQVIIPMPGQEPVTLWKDGRDGFDVKRNQLGLAACEKIMRTSDGVTVSTPRLQKFWEKALGLKNMYVFPNSIVESDWPKVETVKHMGTVRVLWQGGNAHYPDWWEIREGVAECVKRFPEVVWVIWGEKFGWIHDLIPKDKLEFHNWVPYAAYRYKLATLDFDFALAPLIPNRFNACKSAIKWYEAAMMNKPTLVSRTPPYSDEIIEGETALAYRTHQEFVDGFEVMVRDSKLRNTLAQNTRDWIATHRAAEKTVPNYIEWINETKEKVENEKPRSKKRYSKSKRSSSVRNVSKSVA